MRGGVSVKILVDADGCPVTHLAIKVAKEYDLNIILVKNYAHEIQDSYATIITVDISRDSADFYIVNNAEKKRYRSYTGLRSCSNGPCKRCYMY